MKNNRLIVGTVVAGLFFFPVANPVKSSTDIGSVYAEEKLSASSPPAKLKAKLAEIDKRIDETPSAKLYAAKANVLVFLRSYSKALISINKSIQLSPNTGKYYGYRGLIYSALGDVENTINDLEKAKSLGCSDSDYLGLLALAQGEKRDFKNALKNAETALKLDPNDCSALHARGLVYKERKDFQKALKDFNSAIENNKQLAEVYRDRAVVWERLGNKKNAQSDRLAAENLKSISKK